MPLSQYHAPQQRSNRSQPGWASPSSHAVTHQNWVGIRIRLAALGWLQKPPKGFGGHRTVLYPRHVMGTARHSGWYRLRAEDQPGCGRIRHNLVTQTSQGDFPWGVYLLFHTIQPWPYPRPQ